MRGDAVYLVRRPKRSRFFPGFHAFIGGGLEEEDGEPGTLETLARCAVRELEEEVLVRVDTEDLVPAGVTITPPFSPIRYDTQFFLAEIPEGAEPEPQEPELAGGAWFTPERALDAWKTGEVRIPPPVIHALEVLASQGREGLVAKGTEQARFPISFARGLRVEPLKVRTLPPHTHTNAFIVGERELAIIDPGATGPALEPLLEAITMLAEKGAEVTWVLVSHHHQDHIAGVQAVLDATGAQLACSPETADRLPVPVDRRIQGGEVLRVGDTPIEVVDTPGHAPGHLAFLLPRSNAILPGDLVAGIGTVLIPPGEGDMGAYMESLELLAGLAREKGARLMFPSHGPPSFRPAAKLEQTLEHRRMREQRVLEAVASVARSEEEIARRAYEDKPEAPEQLTRLSTLAHLEKLERDGRVRRVEDGWATV